MEQELPLQQERLASLIDFCHQSARLRGRPAATIDSHGQFALHEHELQGLPGVHLNPSRVDDDDELWLAIDRLHETRSPAVTSQWLQPWIEVTQNPDSTPTLRASLRGSALIAAKTHSAEGSFGRGSMISPDAVVLLSDYPEAVRVRTLFNTYMQEAWIPWATQERLRRKTIQLYTKLFTLKQQLEGGIIEAQLELVWGVGMGIWRHGGTTVSYPLISRLAELSLNPLTSALEVRPRDRDPRVELDWYVAQSNSGVPNLEQAAKVFFAELPSTFSPFDRATYEPILRTSVSHLDGNGVYWPSRSNERTLPRAEDSLKITDTWVLFARPRTNSAYLQDLERLQQAVRQLDILPPAVAAMVTEPDRDNPEVTLPTFRGISASNHAAAGHGHQTAQDLYFPKPFNDEQVRIIQLLTVYDGVVVQGPPGTGKTHTIANVICHFLAHGKRVLVTSMKDPALGVLQAQLPDALRPLAVSLLTSEHDGLKKFGHAIEKIASEVQSLDRTATAREIHHLEESIELLHTKITQIDREISAWATKNLRNITIDTGELDANAAAHELVAHEGQYEWISDAIDIGAEFEPRFTDADIVALRDARSRLGQDIVYLNALLPQLDAFPDAMELLHIHQQLAVREQLQQAVETGRVPQLINTKQQTIERAEALQGYVNSLSMLRTERHALNAAWPDLVKSYLSSRSEQAIVDLLHQLGEELAAAQEQRRAFLRQPVSTPEGIETHKTIVEAVNNLAAGRSPFGIAGWFGKAAEKQLLSAIQILGSQPSSSDDWDHVAHYLRLLQTLRTLSIRWNEIAAEVGLPIVDMIPEGGRQASNYYQIFQRIEQESQLEQQVLLLAKGLFPSWSDVDHVVANAATFTELDQALQNHLTRYQLATVWAQHEQVRSIVEHCSGPVVDQIRAFFNETLGRPEVRDSAMQACWSGLLAELSRIHGLRPQLDTVARVTRLVAESGAPSYATDLCQPIPELGDHLLPTNWRQSWRLRRLATHLQAIDAHAALKKLATNRHVVAADLAKAYQDLVVKRTWLKLAENTSSSVRSALQAYLSAIQRIGKGTGKRAVRYRQDARKAAATANAAVPCWIMPHYRVSESLAPELGYFDLVIIDEASQSDLTALPALLRAQKVLIVGDDKQVSPDGVGLEEEKIRTLMGRFLSNQVATYMPLMSPERSVYDLFKVVYAKSSVMLREHFRCVGPIIEYSKREFYNHELQPLRLPRASERLDPPLIDVFIRDGHRQGDVNQAEATYIVEEIKRIIGDQRFAKRSIGVVSLQGEKQALLIWEQLSREVDLDLLQRHDIACGDARTFQGKERDIIFLSMIIAPGDTRITALTRDTYAQRFNVAASRARDRMYLVRSISPEELSENDRLRRSLVMHFAAPFAQTESPSEDPRTRCESDFERDVYDLLTERGYLVTPQVRVGRFRIDLVVEGSSDARLAIECDGDRFHGPDRWNDDMHRQRILERAGWRFWRCFAATGVRRKAEVVADLVKTLAEHGIEPGEAHSSTRGIYAEQRLWSLATPNTEFVAEANPVVEDRQAAATTEEGPPTAELLMLNGHLVQHTTPDVPVHASHGSAGVPTTKLSFASSEPYADQWAHPKSKQVPLDVPFTAHVQATPEPPVGEADSSSEAERYGLEVAEYRAFAGALSGDPREIDEEQLATDLVSIIAVEGPVIARRVCERYLRAVGIKRMGHEIRAKMIRSLRVAIDRGDIEVCHETPGPDLMDETLRMSGSPQLVVRTRGNRSLEEITPGEIQFVARHIARTHGVQVGSEEHLRMVLAFFGLKRLTIQVGDTLHKILDRPLPHVDNG